MIKLIFFCNYRSHAMGRCGSYFAWLNTTNIVLMASSSSTGITTLRYSSDVLEVYNLLPKSSWHNKSFKMLFDKCDFNAIICHHCHHELPLYSEIKYCNPFCECDDIIMMRKMCPEVNETSNLTRTLSW